VYRVQSSIFAELVIGEESIDYESTQFIDVPLAKYMRYTLLMHSCPFRISLSLPKGTITTSLVVQ